jgi:PQQ-dependent dehydrogenase (methanol/ethanol family)
MTTKVAARIAAAAAMIVLPIVVSGQPTQAKETYTAAQSAHGRELYGQHCAGCHGDSLEGAAAPPLAGAPFVAAWGLPTRNVDDLFYILRSSMPRPNMGSLDLAEYVDILAYILSRNGVPAGPAALTADPERLSAIRIPAGAAADETAKPKPQFIAGEGGMTPRGKGPSAEELRNAATGSDWLYHTHDYRGTRYSPLKQIDTGNVQQLQVACMYQLGSLETFMTGPIEYAGTMYVTTASLTAAIDATTCREKWRNQWEPKDVVVWPNNRGVAIEDGYVVRGTSDGYLFALDSADGRLLWARQVARPAAGETITMPPMIFEDLVLVGPAGSENNVQGWIGAFRLKDGSPVWRFNTIPKAGEPGFETWKHDPNLPVGGGAVWSPMSLDVERGELYVPVTNPAPDFPAKLRPGKNLYTNSLLALDVRTGKLRWYVQLVPNDDKDWDLTQVSPIFDGNAEGKSRRLMVATGKDAIVRVLDRDTHEVLHETRIGTRLNEDAPITIEGTRYCPGTLGGVEWNGPAWSPDANMLYVPTVDWCWTATLDPEVRVIPGEMYLGGTVEPDEESQGYLTAIDASTGAIRWQYRSDEPMIGAVTATAGGLLLAAEGIGDLLAFDAKSGRELYRFNTGGSMAGGVVTYAVDGKQYIGAASGKGSLFMGGKGAPVIVVFTLPQGSAREETNK